MKLAKCAMLACLSLALQGPSKTGALLVQRSRFKRRLSRLFSIRPNRHRPSQTESLLIGSGGGI